MNRSEGDLPSPPPGSRDSNSPDRAERPGGRLAPKDSACGRPRSRRDVMRSRHELEIALEQHEMMIAVAAHELHGPLAALSALAHVLRDEQSDMTQTSRSPLIDRILDLTSRLQLLVRELLIAADMDATRFPAVPENISVLAVVNEQIASMNLDMPVSVVCDPELRAVADRAELSMMIGNYLVNAFAYAKPPFQIKAAERDGWTVIMVTDSGPGIPSSFVPHLFERFTRAPGSAAKSGGTGLGLWIARTFARQNGGDAWYEPVPDGGSCFCIRLPRPTDRPGR